MSPATLRAATLALAVALAVAAPAGARSRPGSALARVLALADSARYAAADSAAAAFLAGVPAPAPLDSAAAIEALTHARVQLQRATVPGTRALAERALAIRETLAPRDTLARALGLDRLANVCMALGDYRASGERFERALALRTAVLPADHPLRALGVHNLARVAYALGEYAAARDGFTRALAIRERVLGPRHAEVARSLAGLSAALGTLGDLDGARTAAERALAIRDGVLPRDHPDILLSLAYVARARSAQGDLLGARAAVERATTSAERVYGPDSPLTAQSRVELGNVLDLLGNAAGARDCFERALAIYERVYGPRHHLVVQSLDWLAASLVTQGDLDAAEPLIERGLTLLRTLPDPSGEDLTALLTARARLLMRRGRPAAAESVITDVLHLEERVHGPDHPFVARACVSIGAYRCNAGDCAAARPWFERAVAIHERSARPDSLRMALALDGLGTARMAGGDSVVAARDLSRALAIRERWLGPEHPDLVPTLVHLGMLSALGGRAGEALAYGTRAEEVSRHHLREVAGTSSEREALASAAARVSGLDAVVDAATRPALPPAGRRAAWDAVIRSRALVLDAMVARTHTAREGDSATAARRQAMTDARRNLAALVVRGPGRDAPAAYRERLDHWRHQVDLAERALLEASPELAALRARDTLGFEQVADALPAGGALVAYVRYRPAAAGREMGDPHLAAFVLRAGAREAAAIGLGPAAGLDSLLGRWGAALGRRPATSPVVAARDEREARILGAAVRRRLWDPLVAALASASRVFVVPDGALALVPLAALPTADGRYLAERGPLLHMLTSERDLVRDGVAAPAGHGLLALGGAAFDSVASEPAPLVAAAQPFRGLRARCVEFGRVRFTPLPGSAHEVEDVAALWRAAAGGEDARLLSGTDADEASFDRLAPGRRVLHLATHGFFVDPRCASGRGGGRGVGELADAEPASVSGPAATSAPSEESPLRLSGLALAGANRRDGAPPGGADGILTAEEVASLDLDGVEWAVLSGCDTGVGSLVAGEGVLGLRRAFLVAGAHTVIMSLWPVEDAAAREWMVALYRHRLVGRLGTAESMRATARDMIAERRGRGLDTHPFRWAAFLAAGDWR